MRIDTRLPALLLALGWGSAGVAQDAWTQRKCGLYAAAWQQVLDANALDGVRETFRQRHQDFIDRGCPAETRICARTQAEIDLADLMTVLSMNEGMASTFVPFGCPDRD
ncbi:hypothetical protein I5535_08825 [Rhodobacteraceae bacterium F11138]|nr:hypothetical protein [Rhodobacteraceae bacterium F11138]